MNDNGNPIKVQTRTTFSQRCSPGGPASARSYDGHITDLEDSSYFPQPQAPDRRVNPDLSSQFGDRQVGGPGHVTTTDDPQGNRGISPSPHLITEKAFYTEIQPQWYMPDPVGTAENPFGEMLTYNGSQQTALRVDLTQGSTAFRANCVIVRGNMTVVNQPIPGTSGQWGVQQGTSRVDDPLNNYRSIIPTMDFEHIFICQPLASKTTDGSGWTVPYGIAPGSQYQVAGNSNPIGPGDASGYFSDVYQPYSDSSVALGRVSTKSSNYFRILNTSVNPSDPANQNIDFYYQPLPLYRQTNTPETNYAMFSRGGSGGANTQPYNLGNSSTSDISVTSGQVVSDGTLLEGTYNLNWVDFKYSFKTFFQCDFTTTYSPPSTLPPNPTILGYAPRVVVKGTYLLI